MASFAERLGHRAARTVIQNESLDEETRTEFWNLLVLFKDSLEKLTIHKSDSTESNVLEALWVWHFKKLRDDRPYNSTIWMYLKKQILEDEWFEVLDLIEYSAKLLERHKTFHTDDLPGVYLEAFNTRFERYLVGYRFIGQEITPVDSTTDAMAVNQAVDDANVITGAHHSLKQAIEHLSDRSNPDYANSIKESISAVEAVAVRVTGEQTLGAGLKKLESAGLPLHSALKDAWLKMYGWTSDEAGVRHGSIDSTTVDQALAKYVLITCSAFVSYLVEEGRKRGLL